MAVVLALATVTTASPAAYASTLALSSLALACEAAREEYITATPAMPRTARRCALRIAELRRGRQRQR